MTCFHGRENPPIRLFEHAFRVTCRVRNVVFSSAVFEQSECSDNMQSDALQSLSWFHLKHLLPCSKKEHPSKAFNRLHYSVSENIMAHFTCLEKVLP
jgi:hypothetical protein